MTEVWLSRNRHHFVASEGGDERVPKALHFQAQSPSFETSTVSLTVFPEDVYAHHCRSEVSRGLALDLGLNCRLTYTGNG